MVFIYDGNELGGGCRGGFYFNFLVVNPSKRAKGCFFLEFLFIFNSTKKYYYFNIFKGHKL